MLTALIGAGAGLVSGSIASLIAPWVNHGIERRKSDQEQRQNRIAHWREEYGLAEQYHTVENGKCVNDAWYLSLRPYLPDDLRREIEAFRPDSRVQVTHGKRRGPLGQRMLEVIDDKAREWDVL